MQHDGLLSLQIEIVVGHHRPPPPLLRGQSNQRRRLSSLRNSIKILQNKEERGLRPGSFRGEDFWEGSDGDEDEDRKWKGWRRRRRRKRMRDGWKWRRRRRRRYSEDWTDAFWMFKVLRPYGWSLPLILLSWLAASGPKAFFTSLALPFALSAAALLAQLLWRGAQFDSQGGSDSKRKRSSVGRVSRGRMAEGRNDEKRSEQKQKRASAYDSWLEGDLGLGLDEPSLGGWVDLEKERFPDESGWVTGRQRKGGIESGKESRESAREAEALLLLRVLDCSGDLC